MEGQRRRIELDPNTALVRAQTGNQEAETAVRRRGLEPVELPGLGPSDPRAIPFLSAQEQLKAQTEARRLAREEMTANQIEQARIEREKIEAADRRTAGTEQGSYIPLTDEQGRVVGAWNPKAQKVEQVPPGFAGARKSGLSSTELTARGQLSLIVDELKTLRELATKNRGSIGAVQGPVAAAKRQLLGTEPEVNEMFRISDNLADVLLRARSGAQINEQEYRRLRNLVPNPRLAEGKFFSDLDAFEKESIQILQQRTGTTQQRGGEAGAGVRIRDPQTGRTGTYPGTAEEAQQEGYEVIQ